MSTLFPVHLSFTETIRVDQMQSHLAIPFEVPAGAQQLTIQFEYAPFRTGEYHNLLTLSLFDPHGSRGERHYLYPQHEIVLSAVKATPGYHAGAIAPGTWQVVIDTHLVQEPITYQLAVVVSDEAAIGEAPPWVPGVTAPRGAGWYRGDLHAHTLHSDGSWEVSALAAYARRERLDFVTLTDHNTVSPLAEMRSLAGDDLLTMGGSELTTYFGHALALGTQRRYDWRITPGQRTIHDLLDEVERDGGIFIIAHPYSIGNPACTGCDWTYGDMMPGAARMIEIWNGNWDEGGDQNERGLRQWYDWLNAGYRMRATGGSDIHGAPPKPTTYGRDVVYADALTETAVLDGIRRGHLYLSQGARLELTADIGDGSQAMMGDIVPQAAADLTITWSDAPAGAALRWIVEGEIESQHAVSAQGEITQAIVGKRWCVIELRDSVGMMLAVTNPIYFGGDWR